MRPNSHRAGRKLTLLPLVAATFFMVSGGPYAIEDILGGAGLLRAAAILLILPLFWSLPTALMIGELASAIPEDGGFYIWVRRAMGPFWGYQEIWLSLSASIFDMAIYPAFAVAYLTRLAQMSGIDWFTASWHRYACSLAIVAICCAWNFRGATAVGHGSLWMSLAILAPFAVLVALGFWHGFAVHTSATSPSISGGSLSTAILVAMWNYMGWDNASTVAQEVENPQRTYPRAMIASIVVVALSYVLPLAALAAAHVSTANFATGAWVNAAASLGGPTLGWCVAVGGVLTGIGMFNALVMSYSRLPMAMAEDGLLPRILARRNARGVPWVAVLACGAAWALALNLNFERLITIDLVLYGGSLLLEFVALVILRRREPQLPRPFRAGSFATACSLGIGPAVLIGYALWVSRTDQMMLGNSTVPALAFAAAIALLGPLFYAIPTLLRPRQNKGQ